MISLNEKSIRSVLLRIGIKIVLVIAILLIIWTVFFGLIRIDSIAMDGRINDGDLVLFTRMENSFLPGDVLIFKHENNTYVSSVIAVENDLITLDEQGFMYVNGNKVSDDVVLNLSSLEEKTSNFPYRVSPKSYYVLNKNLDDYTDSRFFGEVRPDQIKGKAIGLMRTRSL